MRVRRLGLEDVDWAVDRLARRRARLAPHAPLYWRRAPGAEAAHRRFLSHVLGTGAVGFRSDDAVLIAVPGPGGDWTVDDADVPAGDWAGTGRQLWAALGREIAGSSIRFVCPVPEPDRREFARRQGLRPASSWWHRPVEPVRPPVEGEDPRVDGATAALVGAPPIYDPGGPILYVTAVEDPGRALPSARAEALRLGSPIVVVDRCPADGTLGAALAAAGFSRHCDFLTGTIT